MYKLFSYRFVTCLFASFVAIHPLTTYASIETSNDESIGILPVLPEKNIVYGKLNNGLIYSLVSTSDPEEKVSIRTTIQVHQETDQAGLSLLLQHALFYGTKELSRSAISEELNQFGLDIDADAYVRSSNQEYSLQFFIPNPEITIPCIELSPISRFLFLTQQLILQPTLTDENIERARQHLLNALSEQESLIEIQETLKRQIANATVEQIRNLYQTWYHPNLMQIIITAPTVDLEIEKTISKYFDSPSKINSENPAVQIAQYHQQELSEESYAHFLNTVQRTTDDRVYVIDGKIWMKEPNWINKKANGNFLGMILTGFGIIGILLAAPIVIPAALMASSVSTVVGIYFLSCGYLKDPQYVDQKRQEDLSKGFEYTYHQGRIGITLTPFERRSLFLQEMTVNPHTLSQMPIVLVADLYELGSPAFAKMFHPSEFNMLLQIKKDFIWQRNQYKKLIENLEAELQASMIPFAIARDAGLTTERQIYAQNYYVRLKNQLQYERDQDILSIEKAYKNGTISSADRQTLIDQIWTDYNIRMNDPEIQAGLLVAEGNLIQAEIAIQATYNFQLEIAKQTIQYNERMMRYKDGKASLTFFFNLELQRILSQYPIYDQTIEDVLDLRSI